MEQEKGPMTDEERLKLAEKLDKELDDFINGLEKRQYTEGWPEDRWEEEFNKHPFFMKTPPKPGDELHPLMEGLQQLKYDPDENAPDDLANNYKEDGNFNFKHKNYRMAIMSYSEGLKITDCDIKIRATLYNNRSASQWFLKNYRSCLRDCEHALKLQPDYDKALQRAANCCYEMKQYDKCLEFCDKLLSIKEDNKEALSLRQKTCKAQKLQQRDERKRQLAEKSRQDAMDKLMQCIKRKGVKLEKSCVNLEDLRPQLEELSEHRVHVDDNGNLVWPVVFIYPEYKVMDFVQEFHDQNMLSDHINELFAERPYWDLDAKYKPADVVVYIEDKLSNKLQQIDVNFTLEQVLKSTKYTVCNGTPAFMMFVGNSPALKHYIDKHDTL